MALAGKEAFILKAKVEKDNNPSTIPAVTEPETASLEPHIIDGEPMVYDLDLGRALGYSDLYKVRKLIGRLRTQGTLGDEGLLATAAKSTGGRPGTAYYLGEKAALKVVTKSETAKADEITDQVIDVFVAARRGLLPQQAPQDEVHSRDPYDRAKKSPAGRTAAGLVVAWWAHAGTARPRSMASAKPASHSTSAAASTWPTSSRAQR